ncbi:hypothetical protein [Lactobacillus delbrueckii]|uniref:hypothetical protein n=1 Tax=Lactobacillus delbrueckii TaxID=1584 RepID=UPI0022237115|nr:hypothetical protein [Lactobacillus delbrueckii]UYX12835.1 hypothetical protein OJ966_00285 [Lactobacillus delbrueckii]
MKKTATILASLSLALGLAAPLAPAASAFAATTQTQTVKSATVGFKLYKTGTTDASLASRFLPSSATVSGDTLSLTVSKESAAMIKSMTINGVAGISTTNSDSSVTFAFAKAYKAGQGTVSFVVATPMGQMTNSADIVFDATDGAYTASAQYLNASDTTKTSMAGSYLGKNVSVTVTGGKVSAVKLTVSAAGAAVLDKVTMNGVAGTRTNNADKTATYTFAGSAYKEGKGEISFEVSAHAGSAVSAVLVLGSLTPDTSAKTATDTKKTPDTSAKTATDTKKTPDTSAKTATDTKKTTDTSAKTATDTKKTPDTSAKTATDTKKTPDTSAKTATDTKKTTDTKKATSKKATKKSTKKASKKSTKKSTKKASKKPTKKSTKKASKKSTKKSTKKASKKPTKKSTKKASKKSTKKSTKKASKKPTKTY